MIATMSNKIRMKKLMFLLNLVFIQISGSGAMPRTKSAADQEELSKDGEGVEARLRDAEEVSCEVTSEPGIFRNGLGDNSVFVWTDGVIPFKIGSGFSAEKRHNIFEAVDEYNRVFDGCIQWVERTDEVLI